MSIFDPVILLAVLVVVVLLVYVVVVRKLGEENADPEQILKNRPIIKEGSIGTQVSQTKVSAVERQEPPMKHQQRPLWSMKDRQIKEGLGKTPTIRTDGSTVERQNLPKRSQGKPLSETEPACTYAFGHLGTLPKNSKIPDECLGCIQIMECLASGRVRK